MIDEETRRTVHKLVLGSLLIIAGVALTLDRLHIIEIGNISQLWPMALVGIGASRFWTTWGTAEQGSGVGLVLMGLYCFAVTFKWFGLTWHNSWPLFLVAVGMGMVWRAVVGGVAGRNGSGEVSDGR